MRCALLPPLRLLAWLLARTPSAWLWHGSGLLARWGARGPLRRRRQIAATNLRLCFPDLSGREHGSLLDDAMQSAVMGLCDSVRAWYAPAHALAGLARVEGLDILAEARAGGRGVILLGAHMCSITLATRLLNDALARAGQAPCWIMKRPHNDACIEAELERRRRAYCGRTIDKRDAPALLAALSGGATVALAADQDFNFQHAFLSFFGVPAATVTAVPSLARRAGAVVLPYWIRREADGRYLLSIQPSWPGYGGGDDLGDTRRYLAAIEAWVSASPGQYLWVHRRFKTRPAGERAFY